MQEEDTEVVNMDQSKNSNLIDMEIETETMENNNEANIFNGNPNLKRIISKGKLPIAGICQPSTSKSTIGLETTKNTGAIKKGTIRTKVPTMEFTCKNGTLSIPKPIYDLKIVKYIKLNTFIFNCSICFDSVKLMEGFVLKNCSHAICVKCMLSYFQKYGGAGNLACPLEINGCEEFMTKNEVNDLVLLINPPVPAKSSLKPKVSNNSDKDQSFGQLTELLEVDLIPNPIAFNCKICYEEIPPYKGVRLQECLHDFCKGCLINTIKNSADPSIIVCPYADDEYTCGFEIQQREVKELLSTYDYYEYLRKTIEIAEMNIKNAFHCKTPNCHYFWELEDKNDLERPYALCESCGKINCFECEVIHHPQTCAEYKGKIAEDKNMGYIKEIVDTKTAMRCSNCRAVIVKSEGCDGMECIYCKTKLCWATKGPRWGPRGFGDINGGCRCDYKNGKPCAPNCTNCH